MRNGGQVSADGQHEVVRYWVYALRDPRDGSVFWVGRSAEQEEISIDRGGSLVEQAAARLRMSAIGADGSHPERLILADGLVTENEAVAVQRAVREATTPGVPPRVCWPSVSGTAL